MGGNPTNKRRIIMNKKPTFIAELAAGALLIAAGAFYYGFSSGIDGYLEYGKEKKREGQLEIANRILDLASEDDEED